MSRTRRGPPTGRARLRVFDVQPGRLQRGQQPRRLAVHTARCARGVGVVTERGRIAACTGAGTIMPACLRTSSRSATSAGRRRPSRPGSPARFERFDSEWTASRPVWPPRRRPGAARTTARVPAQLEVALVAGRRCAARAHPTTSRSCRHQHAGRSDWTGSSARPARRPRPELAPVDPRGTQRRAGQPRADVVGRVGQLRGTRTRSPARSRAASAARRPIPSSRSTGKHRLADSPVMP